MGKVIQRERIKKIGLGVASTSILIMLSVLALYLFLGQETINITLWDKYTIAVAFVPFILIAGLYGNTISLLSFLGIFLTVMIMNKHGAYYLAVYLAAILFCSIFAQRYWLKSVLKTFIAAVIISIFSSAMGVFCFTVIANNNYQLSSLTSWWMYFVGAFSAIFISFIILFLIINYVPTPIKKIFPISYGYMEAHWDNKFIQAYTRHTKVSMRITAIIVAVEILLGASVAWFTVALFPDLKEMINDSHEQGMTFDDDGRPTLRPEDSDEEFKNDLDTIDYKMNKYAISFDMKMLLLILCVGVPFAGLADFYTKLRIGAPIGAMSAYLDNFVNIDDKYKIDEIKKVDSISFESKDEIDILGNNLKKTLHEIAAYLQRQEEEQRLKSDLEVAKQASEAKSSFLSNMSHEIRTPINAVLGMNEMILRECEDEQILEYANNAKSAGNTLLSLVNDILDFSKIEAGKMDIIVAQYHLGSTINDLVNMVSAKAIDKGLELEINVDEHTPCLLIGDEVRIKQCLTNLLSNAVKYTDTGTVTLNIGYEPLNDTNVNLIFEVKDTGIGIKEEDIAKLYSPFERIEEIRNRSIEGTGLGMSIVKKLLALMDTKLEVTSVYGEGSTFKFAVKQQVVSNEEIGNFKEKYKEYLQSTEKYRQRFIAPDAKILVVDDTDMNLTVVRSLLKKTQIIVDTAESGFEALDKVKVKKYDVIFLDHRMPEMDGIETLEAMKVLEGNLNKDVPVISLTANAVSGAKAEYQAHGFSDYLAKPVNGTDLEKMLEKYLPSEKIQEADAESDEQPTSYVDTIPKDSFLLKLKDIDLEEAIKNCAGADVLEKVVKDFLISIDAKADAIEGFLKEADIRNYTVYVHALKSSARLIGAMELSNMAAVLEQKGNEENLPAIQEQTPELLEKYRSYKISLEAAIEKKSDLPEIQMEELEEAFQGIKELVEAYDFKTADSIIKQLEEYSIPASVQEKYSLLIQLMAAVDRDKILEVL